MPVGLEYFLILAVFGGSALTIHALSLAHTNDFVEPSELVGASVSMVVVFGLGSISDIWAFAARRFICSSRKRFILCLTGHRARPCRMLFTLPNVSSQIAA